MSNQRLTVSEMLRKNKIKIPARKSHKKTMGFPGDSRDDFMIPVGEILFNLRITGGIMSAVEATLFGFVGDGFPGCHNPGSLTGPDQGPICHMLYIQRPLQSRGDRFLPDRRRAGLSLLPVPHGPFPKT